MTCFDRSFYLAQRDAARAVRIDAKDRETAKMYAELATYYARMLEDAPEASSSAAGIETQGGTRVAFGEKDVFREKATDLQAQTIAA